MPATIEIPKTLSFLGTVELQAAAKEGDKDTLPKIKLLANTGQPMDLEGFFDPVVVDLEGARYAKRKTPIIADHDQTKRIGHTTEQSIGDNISAVGVVSSTMETAQTFVNDARAGFPFQVSIGAQIKKGFYVEEGDTVEVNGKEWKGPLIVAQKTLINELSVLVLGGDNRTSAKIAAALKTSKQGDQTMKFTEWVKAKGFVEAELTADQKTNLEAMYKTEMAAAAPTVPPADPGTDPALDRIAAREERLAEYDEIFAAFPEVKKVTIGDKTYKRGYLKARAIRDNWSTDKLRLTLLEAQHDANNDAPNIQVGRPLEDGLQATACTIALSRDRMGVPMSAVSKATGEDYGLEHSYTDQELEASDRPELKHIGIHYLMDQAIRAAGATHVPERKTNEWMRAAMRADRVLRAAGGFSTLATSNILEDAAHKALLAMYNAIETVWSFIAQPVTLGDFKTHNLYRLDIHGGYVKTNADGQLGHGTAGDARYQVRGDTYGMVLALNRQDIINDDLNAFNGVAQGIARAAATGIEETVIDLLLTNRASFTTVSTIVDLVIGGISEAEQLMADSVDDNKKPFLVAPDRLLVGSQDSVQAKALFGQNNLLADGVGSTASRDFAENPHQGKYTPRSTTYLNNTAIRKQDGSAMTNQDANQWFLFGNPAIMAALYVGFLNGQQVPTLESADTAFDTLGIQFRSYLDWGVGLGNLKAAVWSPGA